MFKNFSLKRTKTFETKHWIDNESGTFVSDAIECDHVTLIIRIVYLDFFEFKNRLRIFVSHYQALVKPQSLHNGAMVIEIQTNAKRDNNTLVQHAQLSVSITLYLVASGIA